MAKHSLSYYIDRYQDGTLTDTEAAVLLELLQEAEYEAQLDHLMDEQLSNWEQSEVTFPEVKMRVQAALQEHIHRDRELKKVWKIGRRQFYWAVACMIAVLCLGIYYYRTFSHLNNAVAKLPVTKDVPAPESNRAMITLSDGKQVFLDSAGNGQLAEQGNIKLIKLANGQIAYQTESGQLLKELQYNTLTNPKGSRVIDMQLSDGSHVWLNAGSTITYPIAFIGNERKVELKGEGYFEVAKDPSRKFIVSANGTETEVFGTHFNVNAYDNEPETKITLLEGAVRLKLNTSSLMLKPGQQGTAKHSSLSLQTSPDLDQVMAWKQGYFNFDNKKLKEVMRELERWYAISIIYEGKGPEMTFGGNINRNITLNDLLLILEKSGLKYSWNSPRRELTVFY